MPAHEHSRFPEATLERYAEIILRRVYQSGGRERYVPLSQLEDSLGLEEELILVICRTKLLGEIHVADRLHAELEEGLETRTPVERRWMRLCLSEPHLRIRPAAVRLTEEELLRLRKKKSGKKRPKAGRPRRSG